MPKSRIAWASNTTDAATEKSPVSTGVTSRARIMVETNWTASTAYRLRNTITSEPRRPADGALRWVTSLRHVSPSHLH